MHEDEDPDEAAFFQDHGIPQDLLASLGVLDGSLEAVGLASSGVPNVWGVDDGIIGHDQGEDFEDDVDEEIKQEPDDDAPLGGPLQPLQPFSLSQAQKRTGEVRESRPRKKQKAIVVPEKPRTIKDVWPMFEPGKVLNFTQMLQGKVTKKSRAHYQDLGCKAIIFSRPFSRMRLILRTRVIQMGRHCLHLRRPGFLQLSN